MWSKLFYLATLAILTTKAEPPVYRSAPYAAAGWRPQKPFHLPGEYLPPQAPPAEFVQQQRQYPVDFEISKARVDYVGQVQQKGFLANARQPKKHYEAPNKQQELPFEAASQQYKPQQPFFPTQDMQQVEQQRKPAQKYGPPESVNFNINYPDPRSLDEGLFTNGGDVSDFEAAEKNQAPKSLSAEDTKNSAQGQYFILGPDNTIQRVLFTTTQDEEERRTNGFTAQLKYTPVGELKDPVFRYNNKGQLVRVLKK